MAKPITMYSEVIGHRNIIRYVQHAVERDNTQDVLLFYGNAGLGKTSIAKLLAIDIVTRYSESALREKYIKDIIVNDESNDSIKLFNMSMIEEKDEEIQKVKSELNVGFSSTKRKVLILDEAQNMKKKAQDSLLRDLEHLSEGVYVFICTTEIGSLTDAMQSRCKTPLFFGDLTMKEAKQLIKRDIEYKQLQFDLNVDLVVALIADWAENQPRRACNLVNNFEDGQLVTRQDIELFINTNAAPAIIELLKYLYGSLTLGMDYIDSIRLDKEFSIMLLEVCKVALGHVSTRITKNDIFFIKDFMSDKDLKNILQFTCEVCGLTSILRRRVISAFMRAHVSYNVNMFPSRDSEAFKKEDLKTLSQNVEVVEVPAYSTGFVKAKSLEELWGSAANLEE